MDETKGITMIVLKVLGFGMASCSTFAGVIGALRYAVRTRAERQAKERAIRADIKRSGQTGNLARPL